MSISLVHMMPVPRLATKEIGSHLLSKRNQGSVLQPKYRSSGFLEVWLNKSCLIIPCLAGAVLVPEYSKWSDVVLHIPSSMTHQGKEWSEIKGIISDTSWLKLSTYRRRHKGSSETHTRAEGRACFFFKSCELGTHCCLV